MEIEKKLKKIESRFFKRLMSPKRQIRVKIIFTLAWMLLFYRLYWLEEPPTSIPARIFMWIFFILLIAVIWKYPIYPSPGMQAKILSKAELKKVIKREEFGLKIIPIIFIILGIVIYFLYNIDLELSFMLGILAIAMIILEILMIFILKRHKKELAKK